MQLPELRFACSGLQLQPLHKFENALGIQQRQSEILGITKIQNGDVQ
jgi:hypothetical protein